MEPIQTPPTSLVVDIYRNREVFIIAIIAMLFTLTMLLLMKSLVEKTRIRRKIAELSEEEQNLLEELKASVSLHKTGDIAHLKAREIEEFRQKGVLREQAIIKNGEIYVIWVS